MWQLNSGKRGELIRDDRLGMHLDLLWFTWSVAWGNLLWSGLWVESSKFKFRCSPFRMLVASSCQNLDARRMAEKSLRTRREAIGAGLVDDDQIAGLSFSQFHPVGQQVQRGA